MANTPSISVKETNDLLSFVGAFATTSAAVLQDGKVSFIELAAYFEAATLVKPAIDGIAQVPAELADLDDSEKALLVSNFADRFDLPNDKAEVLTEKGLELGLSIAQFIAEIRALKAA